MALTIAAVPVLTGEASDRFDLMMEQSEEHRGSVDFTREIDEARAILSKGMKNTANPVLMNKEEFIRNIGA